LVTQDKFSYNSNIGAKKNGTRKNYLNFYYTAVRSKITMIMQSYEKYQVNNYFYGFKLCILCFIFSYFNRGFSKWRLL